MVLHNHPTGRLSPSDFDLDIYRDGFTQSEVEELVATAVKKAVDKALNKVRGSLRHHLGAEIR